MVRHPHGQNKPHITNSINGEDFYSIFYGQVTIPIEGNQKKRRNAQYFPSNKQGLHVARKNHDIISQIKEKDRIKKSLIATFAMHVISTVDGDQKGKE